MQKLIVVALVGLSSSLAFADSVDNPSVGGKKEKLEVKCKFEGRRPGEFKNPDDCRVECWARALLCEVGDKESKKCKDDENKLEIRCTNGFELRTDDAAAAIANRTLWINGDDTDQGHADRKVATIRIPGVEDIVSLRDREKEANLLISQEFSESRIGKGEIVRALRLEGFCKVEKDHDLF